MRVRKQIEPVQELMRARRGELRRDVPQAGDEFEIFLRRQLVVDHRFVGNPRHHVLGANRIGQRIDAGDADRAGVGAKKPCDHAQCRGLAGTVGPEQRIEFAGAHREIEMVDRGPVKALDQAADLEREQIRGERGKMLHEPRHVRAGDRRRAHANRHWFRHGESFAASFAATATGLTPESADRFNRPR